MQARRLQADVKRATLHAIKGRAATEQDALCRVYEMELREGGAAVDIRLQRTPAHDVEYSALIVVRGSDDTRGE